MTKSPCLTIRADAGPAMGTGHVMRCLALAQAAQDAGMEVTLAGRASVPWLGERLHRETVAFELVPGEVPSKESPADLLARISGADPDWVVLDGYHFGPDCQKAVRNAGYKLLVIDDYNHLPEYHCDILLNQNIGAADFPYRGEIGQKLLGPGYALLRREFLQARQLAQQRPIPEKAAHIILSLGGGDFADFLDRLAPDLALPELTGCILRVIAGKMPEERIRSALKNCPAKVEVLYAVFDMPALMLWADLCISAGGSTCWELCCLGVPFLTVEVAENQRAICTLLERGKIAPRFSRAGLCLFLRSKAVRQAAVSLSMPLVNGCGATALAALLSEAQYYFRPLAPEDREALWKLANSPEVRAVSCSPESIPWQDHVLWFSRRLREQYPLFISIACRDGFFCGYVRFQINGLEATVSIALAKRLRGRGLGGQILAKACRIFRSCHPEHMLVALIREDNEASIRIFTANGFHLAGQTIIGGHCFIKYAATHCRGESSEW